MNRSITTQRLQWLLGVVTVKERCGAVWSSDMEEIKARIRTISRERPVCLIWGSSGLCVRGIIGVMCPNTCVYLSIIGVMSLNLSTHVKSLGVIFKKMYYLGRDRDKTYLHASWVIYKCARVAECQCTKGPNTVEIVWGLTITHVSIRIVGLCTCM